MRVVDLHTMPYNECWELQRQELAAVQAGADSALLLVEHPHVYTLGKSGVANNLLVDSAFLEQIGATFVSVDRGGDITYHGPGQLVGYPILNLDQVGVSLRAYIFRLEEALIATVAHWGIEAGRIEGATGVWVGSQKIAAIGVRASRGVTMHGFALNVSTDLGYFSHINPCGFVDRGVTSIEQQVGGLVAMEAVKAVFVGAFERALFRGASKN